MRAIMLRQLSRLKPSLDMSLSVKGRKKCCGDLNETWQSIIIEKYSRSDTTLFRTFRSSLAEISISYGIREDRTFYLLHWIMFVIFYLCFASILLVQATLLPKHAKNVLNSPGYTQEQVWMLFTHAPPPKHHTHCPPSAPWLPSTHVPGYLQKNGAELLVLLTLLPRWGWRWLVLYLWLSNREKSTVIVCMWFLVSVCSSSVISKFYMHTAVTFTVWSHFQTHVQTVRG